jgi:hypothetical protein
MLGMLEKLIDEYLDFQRSRSDLPRKYVPAPCGGGTSHQSRQQSLNLLGASAVYGIGCALSPCGPPMASRRSPD